MSWKYVFTCTKIMFVSYSVRRKLFSWHCFTHFSKTTAPQQVLFPGKLSTIIIFKLCKFSVNLWTLCFLSYKKYIYPLSVQGDQEKNNPKNLYWINCVGASRYKESVCWNIEEFLLQAVQFVVSKVHYVQYAFSMRYGRLFNNRKECINHILKPSFADIAWSTCNNKEIF